MSLKRKLEGLEATQSTPYEIPPELANYFAVLDNARRERQGLAPLSAPESEWDPRLEDYFHELEKTSSTPRELPERAS